MSLVCWNCRGLGNLRVVPKLKYLVRFFKPDVLFLSETLVSSNKSEAFRYLLGFDSCLAVSCTGRSGGLALYWNSSFNCSVINYSNNHISVRIDDPAKGSWQFTGYYGFPERGRRRNAWDFLRNLASDTRLPWCIGGDFNDILFEHEKSGATERASWLINGFRQAVTDSGLTDIPMLGYPYTWFKSLGTPRAVEERLDRALATDGWHTMFPTAEVENLVAPSSDHYPILVQLAPSVRTGVCRSFKYENAWNVEHGLRDVIVSSWQHNASYDIIPRLEVCAGELMVWSRNNCNRLKSEIEACRKALNECRNQGQACDPQQLASLRH
jgi:exonuclease III